MQLVCAVFWRHLWPLWLHHILRHCLINGAIFGKKFVDIKCVFLFSLQLLFETFLILIRIQWAIAIVVKTSSCGNTRYCCQILIKLEFSRQIFEKKLKCQVSSKSVQWEPSCSMRMDRWTDRLIVAFRNFAKSDYSFSFYISFSANMIWFRTGTECGVAVKFSSWIKFFVMEMSVRLLSNFSKKKEQ
jgi:hypothetical protein